MRTCLPRALPPAPCRSRDSPTGRFPRPPALEPGAGRRQSVGRHPVDETAQRIGHGQRRQHIEDIAQLGLGDLARALAPHHADRFAFAQRHDDEQTGRNLQPFRDAIIVGVTER